MKFIWRFYWILKRKVYLAKMNHLPQGFFKENPVWTRRDPISLILGTRFSLILGTRFEILGTRIGSLKRLKKTLIYPNTMARGPMRSCIGLRPVLDLQDSTAHLEVGRPHLSLWCSFRGNLGVSIQKTMEPKPNTLERLNGMRGTCFSIFSENCHKISTANAQMWIFSKI